MSERSGSDHSRRIGDRRRRSRSRSSHSNRSDKSVSVVESSVILIRNLPLHWEFERVRRYIRDKDKNLATAIKFVKILKNSDHTSTGESLVQFTSQTWAQKAINLLNGAGCEDRALVIEFSDQNIGPVGDRRPPPQTMYQRRRPRHESPVRSIRSQENKSDYNNQAGVTNNLETYGLSISFLNGLGIQLPLLNKIFIANLDVQVDEEKLAEVFGHAGLIKNTFLLKKMDGKCMAKVEYDHPVEAVQAISMFNNQELFGKKMVVHMDNSPGSFRTRMPKGLKAFGPGLGVDGEPMKGIRTVVELQLIKSMLLQELQKQKPSDSQNTMNQLQVDTMVANPALNVQNTVTPFNQQVHNFPVLANMFPLKQTAALLELQNMSNPAALQVQQNLLQPTTDLATTLATLHSQNLAQNIQSNVPVFTQNVLPNQSEWTIPTHSQMQAQNLYASRQQNDHSDYNSSRFDSTSDYRRNMDNNRNTENDEQEAASNSNSSDMVMFNNLPSSVTIQALSNKMREVGELKLAESTGKGRAIVRFYHVADAERCIKLFNRSKVDGQTIDVQFF